MRCGLMSIDQVIDSLGDQVRIAQQKVVNEAGQFTPEMTQRFEEVFAVVEGLKDFVGTDGKI